VEIQTFIVHKLKITINKCTMLVRYWSHIENQPCFLVSFMLLINYLCIIVLARKYSLLSKRKMYLFYVS